YPQPRSTADFVCCSRPEPCRTTAVGAGVESFWRARALPGSFSDGDRGTRRLADDTTPPPRAAPQARLVIAPQRVLPHHSPASRSTCRRRNFSTRFSSSATFSTFFHPWPSPG